MLIKELPNKKLTALLLIIILALSFLTAFLLVFKSSSSSNGATSVTVPTMTLTKNNGKYVVKDDDSKTLFEGSNASYIISSAESLLTQTGGGSLFLNVIGNIFLTNSIVTTENTTIFGVSKSTTYLNSINPLEPVIFGNYSTGLEIHDLAIIQGYIGIWLDTCFYVRVANVAITNMTYDGLFAINCYLDAIFNPVLSCNNGNYGLNLTNCNAAYVWAYCDSNRIGGLYSQGSDYLTIGGTYELGGGQDYGVRIYDEKATQIRGYFESNYKEQIYIDGSSDNGCDQTNIQVLAYGSPGYNVIYLHYAKNTRIDNCFLSSADNDTRQIYVHSGCENTYIGPNNTFENGDTETGPYVSIDASSVRTILAGYPWQNEGNVTIIGSQ